MTGGAELFLSAFPLHGPLFDPGSRDAADVPFEGGVANIDGRDAVVNPIFVLAGDDTAGADAIGSISVVAVDAGSSAADAITGSGSGSGSGMGPADAVGSSSGDTSSAIAVAAAVAASVTTAAATGATTGADALAVSDRRRRE